MANYNKVILLGNLTRDPEMSYLPSQTPVTEFGLAVNRRWKGQDGQNKEETMFVDCRVYGRQAEVFKQYMAKGRAIFIEGRLQLDRWEDQSGQKRSKHRVIVERFQFIGSGGQGGGQQGGGGQDAPRQSYPQQQQQQQQQAPPPSQTFDEPAPPDYDQGSGGEDIPF